MEFIAFAQQHGLIIDNVVTDRWTRVPTEDKPNKRNGSYIWDGYSGAVMDWSVHDKPIFYKSEKKYKPNPDFLRKKEAAEKERKLKQEQAASKAGWLMHKSIKTNHPYLERKGFPEIKSNVYDGKLIVPMRINKKLVGCQMISLDGSKKFLYGQITKMASLTIDNHGENIICEGLATALSIRKVMKHLKERYTIHVAFSAQNMVEISKNIKSPIVVADNDLIGLEMAKKIGKFWTPPIEGYDMNDFEQSYGIEIVSKNFQEFLKKSL